MHPSLTPKNNFRLIAIWSVACAATALAFPRPMLWTFFLAGAALGSIAGLLQSRAMRHCAPQFLAAENAITVRRALTASVWGKLYLFLFWLGNTAIFLAAFFTYRNEMFAGCLAGYTSFALLRELVTLHGCFALQRLEQKSPLAA